jgi:hypothetical protein
MDKFGNELIWKYETEYWLQLCKSSQHYPDPADLIPDLKVIIKVITKIIGTSKG